MTYHGELVDKDPMEAYYFQKQSRIKKLSCDEVFSINSKSKRYEDEC